MRRRLINSTLAVVLVVIAVFGVSLVIVESRTIDGSAKDSVRSDAVQLVGVVENRLAAGEKVTASALGRQIDPARYAVVTLPGETFVSRQSASLLERLGRGAWIAADRGGYVDRAVALAADAASLRREREALRAAVEFRLCDASAQARDFAALLDALCGR